MTIWLDLIVEIIEVLAKAIITVGIPYLFALLGKYVNDARADKYLTIAQETVTKTVAKVNQTFVESLKAEGKFDADAQAEAFAMCKDEIVKALGENVKLVLVDLVGDIEVWLDTEIEAAVVAAK